MAFLPEITETTLHYLNWPSCRSATQYLSVFFRHSVLIYSLPTPCLQQLNLELMRVKMVVTKDVWDVIAIHHRTLTQSTPLVPPSRMQRGDISPSPL